MRAPKRRAVCLKHRRLCSCCNCNCDCDCNPIQTCKSPASTCLAGRNRRSVCVRAHELFSSTGRSPRIVSRGSSEGGPAPSPPSAMSKESHWRATGPQLRRQRAPGFQWILDGCPETHGWRPQGLLRGRYCRYTTTLPGTDRGLLLHWPIGMPFRESWGQRRMLRSLSPSPATVPSLPYAAQQC